MINEDLIAYVQAQLRKNISKDVIISRLVGVGWHSDDISEVFRKVLPPESAIKKVEISQSPATNIVETPLVIRDLNKPDPYHEKIGTGEPEAMANKIWTPIKKENREPYTYVIKKEEEVNNIQPKEPQRPVFSSSFSEANPKSVSSAVYKKETQVAPTPVVISSPEISKQLEVYNEELIPALKPKIISVAPQVPVQVITPAQPVKIIPKIIVPEPVESVATVFSQTTEKTKVQGAEFIPKNNQVTPSNNSQQVVQPKVGVIPTSFSGLKMTSNPSSSDIPESYGVPSGAMLHSYQRAIMSAGTVNEELFKRKRHNLVKWLISILVISAIGGSIFAYTENYIKLPFLNFSIVKKDPKSILAEAPIVLNELTAYKIETVATISLPPLANITSGLVSGEAITSSEKDTISMHAEGLVNHEVDSSPVFDYKATFHSSLFKNDIVTSLKYHDIVSLITTPNLTELLGPNSPKESDVLVPQDQMYVLTSLLPDNIKSKVDKIDIDKLFSVGVPSYINDETSGIFKKFVNSATVLEKEPEDIHGVMSYHYELNADKQISEKFISAFINVFTTGLSDNDKIVLDERLGAVSIDSLGVWIGEEDNKIHQYSFTLSTPLSRVIGLEDKGIAGNMVTLDWKTTYFDFNNHNNIVMPNDALSMADFIKNVSDMKVKDQVSSFKQLANSFHNATGNYGKRSNPTGSCTNPNPSSIFSPVGHPKGASTAVGDIASAMNDILNTTGGALSCYSTSNDWALSAPLSSIANSSYCIDSTGAVKILSNPLGGSSCK